MIDVSTRYRKRFTFARQNTNSLEASSILVSNHARRRSTLRKKKWQLAIVRICLELGWRKYFLTLHNFISTIIMLIITFEICILYKRFID